MCLSKYFVTRICDQVKDSMHVQSTDQSIPDPAKHPAYIGFMAVKTNHIWGFPEIS